jgi:hypothetical protein
MKTTLTREVAAFHRSQTNKTLTASGGPMRSERFRIPQDAAVSVLLKETVMFRASLGSAVLLSAFTIFYASPASATVVYEDSFSRTGPLNAATPDTTTGGATWTASTNWTTDGSRANLNATASHAWLPFTPHSGYVYTLSMTVDCTGDANVPSNPDDWIALGFSNSNPLGGGEGENMQRWHVASNVAAWLLAENDLCTDPGVDRVQTFMGPGTAGGQSISGLSIGQHDCSVVLDTTSALWAVTFKVNGSTVRGPVAYTANPTINYIGFGNSGGTGWVDNLQLTTTPEPSCLLLLCIGLLGLLAYAWRNRK